MTAHRQGQLVQLGLMKPVLLGGKPRATSLMVDLIRLTEQSLSISGFSGNLSAADVFELVSAPIWGGERVDARSQGSMSWFFETYAAELDRCGRTKAVRARLSVNKVEAHPKKLVAAALITNKEADAVRSVGGSSSESVRF